MKFKDRFTSEQRKSGYYKKLWEYNYFGGWGFIILGIIAIIFMYGMFIYASVWTIWSEPGILKLVIVFILLPLIPLWGGIKVRKTLNKAIPEIDWDYIYKKEEEYNKKGTHWFLRKY